jgi:hypothetical protein
MKEDDEAMHEEDEENYDPNDFWICSSEYMF